MTLTALDGPIPCSSPLQQLPTQSAPPLVVVDDHSSNIPLTHTTSEASMFFLLTLLELAPLHLHRFIDPPQPLPPAFETEGTRTELKHLLFLCRDVISFLCPDLLDTEEWDQLIQQDPVLQDSADGDSDLDSDAPIFQDQWEKQWDGADDEPDPIANVADFVLERRGGQGVHRPWLGYCLDDAGNVQDEFDDLEKDGEMDPTEGEDEQLTSSTISCMEFVSRASSMLAEWVRVHGEPPTLASSFAHIKPSLEIYYGTGSANDPENISEGIHSLLRLPVGSKMIDSAFSTWALQYIEPDFDLPDLPPYPQTDITLSE